MRRFVLLFSLLILLTPSLIHAQDADTNSYTWAPGTLTFDYPADWVVRDDLLQYGAVSIATSQEAFDATPLPAGDVLVQVIAPLSTHPNALSRYNLTEMSVLDALGTLTIPTADAPQWLDFGGRTAARLDTDANGLHFALFAVEATDSILLMIAMSDTASFPAYDAQINAIAGSLRTATLTYPAGRRFSVDQTAQTPDVRGVEWWRGGAFDEGDWTGLGGGFGRMQVVDDRAYVASGGNAILIFEADGRLSEIVQNDGISILDLAVDEDGTFWVIDTFQMKVFHLSAEGDVLAYFGQYGNGANQFGVFSPLDIVVVDQQIILLNTSYVNGRTQDEFQYWRKDGSFVATLVASYRDGGRRDSSHLLIGPENKLFFTAGGSVLVSIFEPTGESLGSVPAMVDNYYPGALAIDKNAVIYFETGGELHRYEPLSDTVVSFGTPVENQEGALSAGTFFYPRGMGVLSDGDIFVADSNTTHWQVLRVNTGASDYNEPESTPEATAEAGD